MKAVFPTPTPYRLWVAIGIISFVATIIALLYGSTLTEPRGHGRDSYSAGVAAHRGLFTTLQRLGFSVRRTRSGDFDAVDEPMLFIGPKSGTGRVGDEQYRIRDAIAQRVEAGLTSIVVLPKWRLTEGRNPREVVAPLSAKHANEVLHEALGEEAGRVRRTEKLGVGPTYQTFSGPLGELGLELPWPQAVTGTNQNWEVLLGSQEEAYVIRGQGGHLIVISDPSLAHNATLHLGEHARLWNTLLAQELGADRIAFDEVFHGHGRDRSLGTALGRFPAVLLVIHGMALCLLVALAGSVRFGPPLTSPAVYGRGPREAIRVSGSVLEAGCSLTTLAQRYVEHVIIDLTNRMGMPEKSNLKERAGALDSLAERKGEPARASACLEAAHSQPMRHSEALEIARSAFRLSRLLRAPEAGHHKRSL